MVNLIQLRKIYKSKIFQKKYTKMTWPHFQKQFQGKVSDTVRQDYLFKYQIISYALTM